MARGRAVLAFLCLSIILPGAARPADADTRDEFAARIAAAFRAADKTAALKRLFYLENVDAETLALYEGRIIGRMLARYDAPTVGFEPLPAGFDPVQVRDGYEYRPNLKLVGRVVIDGRTRVPYGRVGGRHYLTAVTRIAVNPGGPPDRTLQMMVVGMASPPLRFDGWCDVMQSNGRLRRMAIADDGYGSRTVIIAAQHIARCRVVNRSARGTMWLRLQEGETETFDVRVTAPDTVISYRR